MTAERQAEEATGIRENPHGIGSLYVDQGDRTVKPGAELRKELEDGLPVEVPNAGAGSYKTFFIELAGYKDIKDFNTSSSAGDWQFAVFDGDAWWIACQENRYPYHGFKYTVDRHQPFPSFEELCKWNEC